MELLSVDHFLEEPNDYSRFDSMVQTPSGESIDTSGPFWRIGPDHVINWANFGPMVPGIRESCQGYIRHLIRNYTPAYVSNQYRGFRIISSARLTADIKGYLRKSGLPRALFEDFKKEVRKTVSEENISAYTGAFVRWYIWSTDAGFDGFDPDVASEFESIHIGGNPQGQAVLSQDPDRGPLREVEMIALRAALKAADRAGTLSVQDLSLAWLSIVFGTNPRNLLLLEEHDVIRTELEDGQTIYEVRIPRIKKRTAGERDQFRTRSLVPELGRLLDRLIRINGQLDHLDGAVRPLFRSEKPRAALLGTAFQSKALRHQPQWVSNRLSNIASILGLRNFEGHPLHISARRLRYTFATRLVQEGASIQEVADALDHTSTDYVMVYFNARSDAVRKLDRALSTILAPIAQAFLGRIIRSEAEATRVGDPSSRIRHRNSNTRKFEGLGNCGELGICGLFAPIACYTCTSFQAWLDGPHEQVLAALEDRRAEKLAEGADPKWTQLYDETILAAELVVQKCAQIKTGEFPA